MGKNNLMWAYISVVFAMICWSLSFVWIKIAFEAYKPLTIITMRLVISSVFLFAGSKIIGRLQKIKKEDYKYLVLLAFFEPFMYFMGESFGLQYVSSTLGSVIIATIPLFCPIAERIFYKDKFSPNLYIGILLSVIGVGVIVFQNGFNLAEGTSLKGIGLLFVAVFAALGYSVVLRQTSHKYNPLTIISWQNFIGIFMFLPFFFGFEYKQFISITPSKEVFEAIILLAIFASSFAFIFYTYSMRHLGISKSSIFCNLIPVFTAFFAYFIINEEITSSKILGISIVISGLFLSQLKVKRREACRTK